MEKEKACLQAKKELDTAVNLEERLKRDRERMLVLLGEHEDFMLSAVQESKRAKEERDAAREEAKQHKEQAGLRTSRMSRETASDDS